MKLEEKAVIDRVTLTGSSAEEWLWE